MGRRRQERAIEAALARALTVGIENGRRQAFESVLLATAEDVLGREYNDVASLVASEGVEDAFRLAGTASREVWPARWRDALGGPLTAVMQAATESAAPVLGSFTLRNPKIAEFFEGYVSELAGNLSATSYDNASRVLREALDEGLGVDDAARHLRERLGELSKSRSELIARTELNRAQNGASDIQARASGVVKAKRYMATLDSRTRPDHAAMNGEEVPIDEPFSSGEMFAGERSVNCRCTQTYVLSDEILGRTA